MSMIEVTRDVKNPLLSRREITCNFKGLSGRLKKLEAVDMISKKFNLDGKIVIPILLKNETGRPVVSGSFYVYEDEKLAKEHLKTAVFARIEKAKSAAAAKAEAETPAAEQAEVKEESK
ncbi:MAG: hypothetical protein ACREAT_05785 [Nitrosotalea sp.]